MKISEWGRSPKLTKTPEFFAMGYFESRFVTIIGLLDETVSMIKGIT